MGCFNRIYGGISMEDNNPVEKLNQDLLNAEKLLSTWIKDPAEVFVKYGLADSKEDVKITVKKPDEPPTLKSTYCGCACAMTLEFEFQYIS